MVHHSILNCNTLVLQHSILNCDVHINLKHQQLNTTYTLHLTHITEFTDTVHIRPLTEFSCGQTRCFSAQSSNKIIENIQITIFFSVQSCVSRVQLVIRNFGWRLELCSGSELQCYLFIYSYTDLQ